MKPACKADLGLLKQLAFRRVTACGDLIRRFHRLPKAAKSHEGYPSLEKIRGWLLSPFTLWPVDFAGIADHVLRLVETGKKLDGDATLLLTLVNECPCAKEQKVIGDYEHNVQTGNYTALITAQPKFEHKEKTLFEDPHFRDDWEKVKARFDINRYRDKKGIIRRRLAKERSFRPEGWEFRWKQADDRFLLIFDAFCHKWILYGMEGEQPLLQKLSVNVTPFGTMIFIPRYWSFDPDRDLRWGAITKLHRSREVHRQGAKLGLNQEERRREASRVQRLWREATQAGLKGDGRYQRILSRMNWSVSTDFSKIKRLMRVRLVETKQP